jgi:hypothetical protein
LARAAAIQQLKQRRQETSGLRKMDTNKQDGKLDLLSVKRQ